MQENCVRSHLMITSVVFQGGDYVVMMVPHNKGGRPYGPATFYII